jgi:hypothetical protein
MLHLKMVDFNYFSYINFVNVNSRTIQFTFTLHKLVVTQINFTKIAGIRTTVDIMAKRMPYNIDLFK